MFDNSVWSSKMLDSIQGANAIAEIPLIETMAEKQFSRRVRIIALAGVPVALTIMAVTVHYVLRPLDVIWFVMLRKLGI